MLYYEDPKLKFFPESLISANTFSYKHNFILPNKLSNKMRCKLELFKIF